MELSKPQIIKYIKAVVPIILGATGGYTYYHFIGCSNGVCPITSNPYISTLYGSVMGALFIPTLKKKSTGESSQ